MLGVGIKLIPLALKASVLTITPPRLPDVTTLHMTTCLCCSLHERAVLLLQYVQSQTIHHHSIACLFSGFLLPGNICGHIRMSTDLCVTLFPHYIVLPHRESRTTGNMI